MYKKIGIWILKFVAYLVFVFLAVYFTPKILSKTLNTQYPLATITSGSMWPQLKIDDLILMKGIKGEEAKVGEIIIFKNDKGFTIHRLIKKQGDMFITKGDANNIEDAPITKDQIIGRIVYFRNKPFRIPKLGIISKNLGPKLQETGLLNN